MPPTSNANAVNEWPWLEQCHEAIAKLGGVACPDQVCSEHFFQAHRFCFCEQPYPNGCEDHPSPDCCENGAATPFFVARPEGSCFCCCGMAGEGLRVASDETDAREAHEFAVGDSVWAATGEDLSRWEGIPVAFSAGTGAGGANSLVRVHFGEPERGRTVFVSRDQPFLVSGAQRGAERKLKRASKLAPGKDELLQPDGTAVPIQSLAPGEYERIVHHLSTSVDPAEETSGHLIVLNGVVGGDYSLQLANLERDNPDLLVEGHADLPDVCTEEYIALYPDVDADQEGATAPRP